MKKINQILFLVVFLFIIILTPSCGGNENAESDNLETGVTEENLVIVNYAIEGMVCAMGCAATIQEELLNMDGVVNCEVDFEAGKAHVEFDKSKLAEEDVISKIESIADGQYKVSKWIDKEEINEEDVVDENGNNNNKSTTSEIRLPSFEIPNLLTLLVDQI